MITNEIKEYSSEWKSEAKEVGATNLLIYQDPLIGDFYPVFIMPDDDSEKMRKICEENGEFFIGEIDLSEFNINQLL